MLTLYTKVARTQKFFQVFLRNLLTLFGLLVIKYTFNHYTKSRTMNVNRRDYYFR